MSHPARLQPRKHAEKNNEKKSKTKTLTFFERMGRDLPFKYLR